MIRGRIDLEVHQEVFVWIVKVLATRDLLRGKTVGVGATTLEANAALRSIVRKDKGESYTEFLTALAVASGIETPTRADLAKLDRKRMSKGSNKDWENPHDPDAKITKMKDGLVALAAAVLRLVAPRLARWAAWWRAVVGLAGIFRRRRPRLPLYAAA